MLPDAKKRSPQPAGNALLAPEELIPRVASAKLAKALTNVGEEVPLAASDEVGEAAEVDAQLPRCRQVFCALSAASLEAVVMR